MKRIVIRNVEHSPYGEHESYHISSGMGNKPVCVPTTLTQEQEALAAAYWRRFHPYYSLERIGFYTHATARFDPRYVPDDVFYVDVDPYFNDYRRCEALDDKNLYGLLFQDVPRAKTVVMRVNGQYLNRAYRAMSAQKAAQLCMCCSELVVKPANASCGGAGIAFVKPALLEFDTLAALLAAKPGDLTVQQTVAQHPLLAALHPSSVNTLRIITLLWQGEAVALSTVLRMGRGGSRVDNCSSGGIACGVGEDGRLKACAYATDGTRFDEHPQSGAFAGLPVPAYRDAVTLCKRLQERFPYFRLISWDIAVSPQAQPILIEMNACMGQLDFHQLCNGPLFGERTEAVMREVFGLR